MKKLRMGIVGSGWMADMCCDEVKSADNIELAGVYSRNSDNAKKFSEKHSIPFFTDDINALLRRDDVDAVYIATTNDAHKEFALKAIEAGKPTIVEKPFTLNYTETKEVVDCAEKNDCFLMEAMWMRFFPSILAVNHLIKDGTIGELKSIKTHCGLVLNPEDNARVFVPKLGGGVLVDIGVYQLSFIQMVTGKLPQEIQNAIKFSESGVDIRDDIVLRYDNGLVVELTVSGEEFIPDDTVINGSKGTIICRGGLLSGEFIVVTSKEERRYNFASERFRYIYHYEFEHFAQCVLEQRKESYIVPVADTLKVMQMMDACRFAGGYYYPQEK